MSWPGGWPAVWLIPGLLVGCWVAGLLVGCGGGCLVSSGRAVLGLALFYLVANLLTDSGFPDLQQAFPTLQQALPTYQLTNFPTSRLSDLAGVRGVRGSRCSRFEVRGVRGRVALSAGLSWSALLGREWPIFKTGPFTCGFVVDCFDLFGLAWVVFVPSWACLGLGWSGILSWGASCVLGLVLAWSGFSFNP